MAYRYLILRDATERLKGVQGILGVDDDELNLDELDVTPIGPAAELEVIERVPDYATLQDTTYLKLAILYFAAANALPGIKNKVMMLESDNRSMAERFKDAFSKDPADYVATANKYIEKIDKILLFTGADIQRFSRATPAKDEVTGAAYVDT